MDSRINLRESFFVGGQWYSVVYKLV